MLAVTVEEIEREIGTLARLRDRAQTLLRTARESKFDKLREVLEDPRYADEKWLVFSEHRDTVDYLVRRLEGLGYGGRVAQIHGGMAWPEREEQVERFRDPSGARYLVATDAAGEGINLQFCRLMVNYDIPWNPARLEQRMGRIHRYGQEHDVQIVNLIAGKTREGHVLRVLLEKLDAIRRELDSDKVFDVVGQLFDNRSLRQYMLDSLDGDKARSAAEEVGSALTADRVRALGDEDRRVYGDEDGLTARLEDLRVEMEREQYVQLLPGYVRRFVERAAGLLGLEICGDLDDHFGFASQRAGALDPLLPALESYPSEARDRLCVWRPDTKPGASAGTGASAVWLHPGEPVFDALAAEVLNAFEGDALQGAVLVDNRADAPYTVHLALGVVEEEPGEDAGGGRRVLARHLLSVRHNGEDGAAEDLVERFLLLRGAPDVPPGAVPMASRALEMRDQATAHADSRILARLVEERRDTARTDLPARRLQVAAGFGLRGAEMAGRRAQLTRSGDDAEALERVKAEQRSLFAERRDALQELSAEPERIVSGGVRFFAHALVVPAGEFGTDHVEPYDAPVEERAVATAVAWERQHGGEVRDVSKPQFARRAGFTDWPGFDLVSDRPDGERRHIEVKGRASHGDIQMEENEWKQACHWSDQYWLYVVLDCATPSPRLLRIRDPFGKLIVSRATSARYAIPVGAILEAAEDDGS